VLLLFLCRQKALQSLCL